MNWSETLKSGTHRVMFTLKVQVVLCGIEHIVITYQMQPGLESVLDFVSIVLARHLVSPQRCASQLQIDTNTITANTP